MRPRPILAQPNPEKTALHFPSAHNRRILLDWLKKYKWIEIRPRLNYSRKVQRFVEAAVIPAYGKWQYSLNPLKEDEVAKARILFKQDFHFEIVRDRSGEPKKVIKSLEKSHNDVLEKYVEYAEANGAPVPNPELYKLWRDKYSHDWRWDNYFDWLTFLGLEVDSMPSRETLAKADETYSEDIKIKKPAKKKAKKKRRVVPRKRSKKR